MWECSGKDTALERSGDKQKAIQRSRTQKRLRNDRLEKNNGTDVSALPKRISTHQPRTPPGSASRLEHSMHPSGGLSLVRTLGGKRPAYLVRVRVGVS